MYYLKTFYIWIPLEKIVEEVTETICVSFVDVVVGVEGSRSGERGRGFNSSNFKEEIMKLETPKSWTRVRMRWTGRIVRQTNDHGWRRKEAS